MIGHFERPSATSRFNTAFLPKLQREFPQALIVSDPDSVSVAFYAQGQKNSRPDAVITLMTNRDIEITGDNLKPRTLGQLRRWPVLKRAVEQSVIELRALTP